MKLLSVRFSGRKEAFVEIGSAKAKKGVYYRMSRKFQNLSGIHFFNVYLLVRHVPFIAKGAVLLLQCTKCSREGSLCTTAS